MPGCILRVLGDSFSPDDFLATARLPVLSRFTKGEQLGTRRRPSRTGGFTCEVSPGTATFSEQVDDAMKFLESFKDDLALVRAIPTVESFFFDFAHECRINGSDVMVQRDFLPPELLRRAGSLGAGICLTLLPAIADQPSLGDV